MFSTLDLFSVFRSSFYLRTIRPTARRNKAIPKKNDCRDNRERQNIPGGEQSHSIEWHVVPESGSIYDCLFEDYPRVNERRRDSDLDDQR
jgi:hypothetical protein